MAEASVPQSDQTSPGNIFSSSGQKEQAEIKHQYSIDELKHRENLIRVRLEDEQARQKELEEHKVHSSRGALLLTSFCPRSRMLATGYQSSSIKVSRAQALKTHFFN